MSQEFPTIVLYLPPCNEGGSHSCSILLNVIVLSSNTAPDSRPWSYPQSDCLFLSFLSPCRTSITSMSLATSILARWTWLSRPSPASVSLAVPALPVSSFPIALDVAELSLLWDEGFLSQRASKTAPRFSLRTQKAFYSAGCGLTQEVWGVAPSWAGFWKVTQGVHGLKVDSHLSIFAKVLQNKQVLKQNLSVNCGYNRFLFGSLIPNRTQFFKQLESSCIHLAFPLYLSRLP